MKLPTLDQIFHARHAQRHLNSRGYIRYHNWRLYGEEGLAGEDASVWLFKETFTIAFQEEPLAQYTVVSDPNSTEWQAVLQLRAIPPRNPSLQLPLWDIQTVEWYKVKKLLPYAPRQSLRIHGVVQECLFA